MLSSRKCWHRRRKVNGNEIVVLRYGFRKNLGFSRLNTPKGKSDTCDRSYPGHALRQNILIMLNRLKTVTPGRQICDSTAAHPENHTGQWHPDAVGKLQGTPVLAAVNKMRSLHARHGLEFQVIALLS